MRLPPFRVVAALCLSTFSISCTTVQSISISQIPDASMRKHEVRAGASSPVIFLIPFNTDYLEEARSSFVAACPGGAIEGVLSKHEDTRYLGTLFYTQKVQLSGYCLPKTAGANAKAKRKA